MENHQNIEVTDSGIVCDNPQCDYEDKSVLGENLSEWVDRPCPKCGENLLTQQDLDDWTKTRELLDQLNGIDPAVLEELVQKSGKSPEQMMDELRERFPDVPGIADVTLDGTLGIGIHVHKGVRITEIRNEPEI